jgi:glutamyl-tRNA synthetase
VKACYAAYAEELIKNGWAYYAFDSSEALEQARKEQEEKEYLYIQSYQQRILDTSLYYQRKKLSLE